MCVCVEELDVYRLLGEVDVTTKDSLAGSPPPDTTSSTEMSSSDGVCELPAVDSPDNLMDSVLGVSALRDEVRSDDDDE